MDNEADNAPKIENEAEYAAKSEEVNSGHFCADQVEVSEFVRDLEAFVAISRKIDQHKKVLFRGRSREDAGFPPLSPAAHLLSGCWPTKDSQLLHSIVGTATEAGEYAEVAIELIRRGTRPDPTNVKEELGDIIWYLVRGMLWAGVTLFEVLTGNLRKLFKRHGKKFSAEGDVNRDTEAERKAIDG